MIMGKTQPNTLLLSAIDFLEARGYLTHTGFDATTGKITLFMLYPTEIQTPSDKKKLKGAVPCVCRVNLTIRPDSTADGRYNFQADHAFSAFKNHLRQPGVLNLVVGTPPCNYTEPEPGDRDAVYFCTEAEAIRMVLTYFWSCSVDSFAPKRSQIAKANALNPRYGHSVERLIELDVEFFQACRCCLLTSVGEFLCNYLSIAPGDSITFANLKEKDSNKAPIKTDIMLSAGGRSVKLSIKAPQTSHASNCISILGLGTERSRSGLAEVISCGDERVCELIYSVNKGVRKGKKKKGRWKDLNHLDSTSELSHDDAEAVRNAFYIHYADLARLALLGEGNPYSADSSSVADVVVEFNLHTGDVYIFTADVIHKKLANMTLEDFKACFPISNTSSNTVRVAFNAPKFDAIPF